MTRLGIKVFTFVFVLYFDYFVSYAIPCVVRTRHFVSARSFSVKCFLLDKIRQDSRADM